MTRTVSASVLSSVLALAPAPGWCAASLERYTLVIGANSGGANRPQLLYAVSDAERFARVMIELGGVAPPNEIVLKQPKLHDLIVALDTLTRRVADARKRTPPVGRTEVILYYSGHADEQGLLLGDDRYSYRTLRDRLDQIPADVRIAVLDACSSGAFTRVKGGRARPPFMIDEAADMRGHAFLTSSAETEAAQESDRIRASYFTHYLISGFRGAADVSGDGKVTLNEAYQFAFNETLGRTVDTKGGAQHPSYDISLSGTGDVVMTDVRQTTATLVLGEDLEGRFFVRTASQELVVELYKPRGRLVELAVEPGTYEVRVEREKGSVTARAEVVDGARVAIDPRQFGPVAMEPTRRRGDSTRYAVAGRNRIEMRLGSWRVHGPPVPVHAVTSPGAIVFFGKIVDLQVDRAASAFGEPGGDCRRGWSRRVERRVGQRENTLDWYGSCACDSRRHSMEPASRRSHDAGVQAVCGRGDWARRTVGESQCRARARGVSGVDCPHESRRSAGRRHRRVRRQILLTRDERHLQRDEQFPGAGRCVEKLQRRAGGVWNWMGVREGKVTHSHGSEKQLLGIGFKRFAPD